MRYWVSDSCCHSVFRMSLLCEMVAHLVSGILVLHGVYRGIDWLSVLIPARIGTVIMRSGCLVWESPVLFCDKGHIIGSSSAVIWEYAHGAPDSGPLEDL
jgi:hypothetical protein